MSKPTLVPKDHAEEVALFRSQIVGPLTRQLLQRGELSAELSALSHKLFRPPGLERSRSFSIPTLERWYYAYREGGMLALCPKPRSDAGHAHKLSDAQRERIATCAEIETLQTWIENAAVAESADDVFG